jgi:tRNA pseudouridine55 synthase
VNPRVLNAVLPVDKPVGPTSHDVVGGARRALGIRRIGHTGTLDPFASGLLLLCVGRATRIAQYLTALPKRYVATARLGVTTDTLDREGTVVEERAGWETLAPDAIGEALDALRGELLQVPPQFSAKKVAGEAMHRRARRGESVELEPRPVTVYEIELLDIQLPLVRFEVLCSSGTYVRALARDAGQALGCGAHLTELRRTSVGAFDVDGALTLDALEDEAAVAAATIDPLAALTHMRPLHVDGDAVSALTHGRAVACPSEVDGGPVAASADGRLVAVGAVRDGCFRPKKVFVDG